MYDLSKKVYQRSTDTSTDRRLQATLFLSKLCDGVILGDQRKKLKNLLSFARSNAPCGNEEVLYPFGFVGRTSISLTMTFLGIFSASTTTCATSSTFGMAPELLRLVSD